MRPKQDAEVMEVKDLPETEEEVTEDLSESSADEEEVETTTEEPEVSEEKPEVEAEVEEETKTVDLLPLESEREKLLKQITELRAERRELRQKKEVFVDKTPEKNLLEDVSPQDVQLIEKVLKAKGYVRQSDVEGMTYTQRVEQYQNEWLAAHPEYLPENDPEDTNWNKLRSYVDNFFKAPSNPALIGKVLDMAHSALNPQVSIPTKTRAATEAKKEKLKSSSKGSTGGEAGKTSVNPKNQLRVKHLKGFSEDELKELLG